MLFYDLVSSLSQIYVSPQAWMMGTHKAGRQNSSAAVCNLYGERTGVEVHNRQRAAGLTDEGVVIGRREEAQVGVRGLGTFTFGHNLQKRSKG